MTITEPATLATDYLMAAMAIAAAWKLRAERSRDWSMTFLFLAAASFVGGSYHGFATAMSEWMQAGAWRATLALSALSSMYLLFAGAGQFEREGRAIWWKKAGILKFLLSLAVGLAKPVFLVVLVDFTLTIAAVSAMAVARRRDLPQAAATFLAGAGLFVTGGLVQALHLSPHPSFNHNDLFHVIQIAGNCMFYLAARKGLL